MKYMMGNKVKSLLRKPKIKAHCCHYWLIESPGGHISRGICKYCGAEREFFNALEDIGGRDTKSEFVDPDDLPND